MVQVDVFWSYGLSSGLALAASQGLKREASFWNNKYFNLTLMWSALVFGPSGIYLLWAFPGWETMFVAENHLSIPPWLVCLFSITNITQGILGFYVTWYFIRKNKMRTAAFQTVWSHLAMISVLIFGWDGSGYRRFFYAGTGEEWQHGVYYPLTDFFTAPIFFTLLGLGVVVIPSLAYLIRYFQREGRKVAATKHPAY